MDQKIVNQNIFQLIGDDDDDIEESPMHQPIAQPISIKQPEDNGSTKLLGTKWVLWVHDTTSSDWSFGSYTETYSISNISEFWKLYFFDVGSTSIDANFSMCASQSTVKKSNKLVAISKNGDLYLSEL